MSDLKNNKKLDAVSQYLLKKVQPEEYQDWSKAYNQTEPFLNAYRNQLDNQQLEEEPLKEKLRSDARLGAISKIRQRYTSPSFLNKASRFFVDKETQQNPKTFIEPEEKTAKELASQNIEGFEKPKNFDQFKNAYVDLQNEAAEINKKRFERNRYEKILKEKTPFSSDYSSLSKAEKDQLAKEYDSTINYPTDDFSQKEDQLEDQQINEKYKKLLELLKNR
jgi:hypothetical protein